MSPVQAFDTTAKFCNGWGRGNFGVAHGLRVAAEGNGAGERDLDAGSGLRYSLGRAPRDPSPS